MNTTRKWLLVVTLLLHLGFLSSYAQITVYDSLNTAVTAGTADFAANNPIHGDTLTLASGGTLGNFGASLYNSSSSAGTIFSGNTTINFYDNTVPYTSGTINNPLLGTAVLSWDYTFSGGLPP